MQNKHIKSPLNYIGGKYKLLPQILPLFPNNINVFVDLFGGGFNVGINVKSKYTIYNDLESHVVNLLKYLSDNDVEDLLEEIDTLIEQYNLSKENAEGYAALRNYYNENNEKNNSHMIFYTLICYSFNNQIRFNQSGKYNMPFGKNRSSFNPTLRAKFIDFVNALHNKDYKFTNMTFEEFFSKNINYLGSNDFVYCDPPYFNSIATYNEQNGWTEDNEKLLLQNLDKLNEKGIKFALSNNLKYDNPLLDKWKNKYNIHYLNGNYNNCNYQKIDKSKDIEVLITNF